MRLHVAIPGKSLVLGLDEEELAALRSALDRGLQGLWHTFGGAPAIVGDLLTQIERVTPDFRPRGGEERGGQ